MTYRAVGEYLIRVVGKGETLWGIARDIDPDRHATTFQALGALNGWPHTIHPGQALLIDPAWFPVDDTHRDGWLLVHDIGFEVDDGYELRQETQSNDASYNLPRNAIFGPDGLRLIAKRESAGGRAYTSADVLGKHTPVPNYFRAEVVAKLPTEYGQWPCPLWFRPTNSPDGEIDVVETWPAFWDGEPVMWSAIHSEYGTTHRQENARLLFSALPNPDPADFHLWSVEKTPGRMRFECDGVLIYEWERSTFNASLAGWWDRIFEVAGRRWYPRYTVQVGGPHAKEPLPDWQESEMVVRSFRAWEPA